MVIVLWTLVGLFWAGVIANTLINKSQSLAERRKRLSLKVSFAVLDAVDWVRVKVFRRKPWKLTQAERNALQVKSFFEDHGIHIYVRPDAHGNIDYFCHPDDLQRIHDIVDEIETQGFKKTVDLSKS